ncbi:unnamed protein product [Paramecium sonneborni]|uniref:Tetratricopeptide repeat protein n=1 Tax=Paramecium sonneborni TaxID=65129 RepID=A0A8S1RWV4_9CILI|nr:unnamed protein product [Paramecium sonneborni]
MLEQKVIEQEKKFQFKSQHSQSLETIDTKLEYSNINRIVSCENIFQVFDKIDIHQKQECALKLQNIGERNLKEKQIELKNFQKIIMITISKLKQIITEYKLFSTLFKQNIFYSANNNQEIIQNNKKQKNRALLKRVLYKHKILIIKIGRIKENQMQIEGEASYYSSIIGTNIQQNKQLMTNKFHNQNRIDSYFQKYKAISLDSQNRFEETLKYFDYEGYKTFFNKGKTLYNLNRFKEALQNFDYAIQKNPEDSLAFRWKAVALEKLNRFEEALQNFDYAIQKNPEDSLAFRSKGKNKQIIKYS